jgi:uncharacterized membrane protein
MAVNVTLDRVFRVSVILKAIDGVFEIVGGLLLLVVSPDQLDAIARSLTQHELSEDPHDFFANHLLRATGGLTHATTLFAGIYLLSHGIAKVVVIVAVLRGEMWAYPAMIVLLGAFIVYQLYRLSFDTTVGLSLLTIFDAFVVWLTWREWQARRATDSR